MKSNQSSEPFSYLTLLQQSLSEDVIPLGEPLVTATGEVVDSIKIGAGVPITVPTRAINRSEAVWGSDAKEFKPERWLDEAQLPSAVKEMPGYHHILSFIDGPRICIGRLFAVAEFKVRWMSTISLLQN